MRLWRSERSPEEAPAPFVWTIVTCDSRESAQAESERRQAAEESDAVWIYLQMDGRWVARRTPADPTSVPDPYAAPTPLLEKLADGLLEGISDAGAW